MEKPFSLLFYLSNKKQNKLLFYKEIFKGSTYTKICGYKEWKYEELAGMKTKSRGFHIK